MSGSDIIRIRDLRVLATHGVLDEERNRAQPFTLDLDLHLDVAAAGSSDDLADTVDYGAAARRAAEVVAGESHRLLERVATRVCEEVLGFDARLERVTVEVTKVRPPVPVDVGATSVRLTRSRSEVSQPHQA